MKQLSKMTGEVKTLPAINKHLSIGVDLCCVDGCGVVVNEGEGFEWVNRTTGTRFIYCCYDCAMEDISGWGKD